MDNRTVQHKKAMILAMQDNLGIVTKACRMAGVSRTTYYEWIKTDGDFRLACEDCSEMALDEAEDSLHRQIIEDKNPTSTIFYLKTKGRGRGYIEKQDIDITSGGRSILDKIRKEINNE